RIEPKHGPLSKVRRVRPNRQSQNPRPNTTATTSRLLRRIPGILSRPLSRHSSIPGRLSGCEQVIRGRQHKPGRHSRPLGVHLPVLGEELLQHPIRAGLHLGDLNATHKHRQRVATLRCREHLKRRCSHKYARLRINNRARTETVIVSHCQPSPSIGQSIWTWIVLPLLIVSGSTWHSPPTVQ